MLQDEKIMLLNNSSVNVSYSSRSLRGSVYPYFKRFIDIVAALAIGLFVLPLLLIVGFIIRLDGHKALYFQERLGENGRIFRIWKLRTMVPDADQRLERYLTENPEARLEWDLTQKLRSDPRITFSGRFLRKYSVDELPQLWNVLVGDMSLVGPRPMFPQQRALYPGTAYFEVRPGMTGLWQVGDRNKSTFADRAKFDTCYVETLSFRTDMMTILKTFGVVFRGTGC